MADRESPETELVETSHQAPCTEITVITPLQTDAELHAILDRMERNWYRDRDPYCCHLQ
ncbi:MAG: hypothetical protein JWN18_561 [Parcubacteria group bacterium]|nr:hypothetical protein [Parcubacteria group bacterium]